MELIRTGSPPSSGLRRSPELPRDLVMYVGSLDPAARYTKRFFSSALAPPYNRNKVLKNTL